MADTWEFDGSRWKQVMVESPPGIKLRHNLTYDPAGERIILFGGKDLWSWDGTIWKLLANDGPEVFMAAACMDESSSRLQIFGGVQEDDLLTSATWFWDGHEWHCANAGQKWAWSDTTENYYMLP